MLAVAYQLRVGEALSVSFSVLAPLLSGEPYDRSGVMSRSLRKPPLGQFWDTPKVTLRDIA
jgi:hypothetical protein